MRKTTGWVVFGLLSSALLASCSETVGVTQPPTGSALDYFWSSGQLMHGFNYYVVRLGVGATHLLSSSDGSHIQDAALNNQVTMVAFASEDSVLVDSMGINSLFSLPNGYFFGRVLPADTVKDSTILYDTTVIVTTIVDTVAHDTIKDTTLDTISSRDSVFQHITRDTAFGGLLLLYRANLDSGKSWQAGTVTGPGFPNGLPVTATVLDRVDSLLLKPVTPGADSSFGPSFQIRYALTMQVDSATSTPIYWLAYYSKNVGPVLIEQYVLQGNGTYMVTRRAQIVSEEP